MKTNIFLFGMGENKYKLPKNLDNFNVIVGPSKEEHAYLINNSPYYKKSFEAKRYAFCSDVGRIYILSRFKGLYIDFSVTVGKDIDLIIRDLEKYKVALFRGNYSWIENGVMGSGQEENTFFKSILDFYKGNLSLATFISPAILSNFVLSEGIAKGGVFSEKNNIAIYPLSSIRDKSSIWKTSVGSGTSEKKSNDNYFESAKTKDLGESGEQKFNNRIIDLEAEKSVEMVGRGHLIDIRLLKNIYEHTSSKEIRKQLCIDYKTIKYRLKITERLFGSKLYVFFDFKRKIGKNKH